MGGLKSFGMMQGIDDKTQATMFVGYHAAAGHGDGVLNHTMRSRDVLGVFLNDEPAGELRLNAALAGWFGVPVALCENLPGIKRVASRDIEYTSNNYPEIYRLLRVLLALAASVAALPYSYD